jgi:uncharacterized pyridoxamine 5'-phosphate oxidase family protein
MAAVLTSDRVWRELEKQLFAVLGYVTPAGRARTIGIVFVVRDRELYIVTDRNSWKARHIEPNPHVSLTVTIPKRIPLAPWLRIPAATISFQGEASLQSMDETPPEITRSLTRGLEDLEQYRTRICILRVRPCGEFVTYGVGVPLLTMRRPEAARGRAPVWPVACHPD